VAVVATMATVLVMQQVVRVSLLLAFPHPMAEMAAQ